MAMIIMMKSTFTDHGLCAEGHGAEPSTSIILTFMLSDCASLVYYRNWSLGRSRHIPRVTELVGGAAWIHTQATCLLATPRGEARLRAWRDLGWRKRELEFPWGPFRCLASRTGNWSGSKSSAEREGPRLMFEKMGSSVCTELRHLREPS